MSFVPKRCVFVPIDFSEASFEALRVAREVVSEQADLHVVHVLPVLNPGDPGVVWEAWKEGDRIQDAKEHLVERLKSEFPGVQVEVAVGDAAREIAERAARAGADLIVMPSHGRKGVERFFIGSVAERVLRYARCPVLILRG